MIKKATDTAYAVRFINLMQKEFSQWTAFKFGIIDDKGNLIKRPKTPEEKNAYTPFHASIRAMKQLMNTVPGGSKLAAMAASWSTVSSRFGLTEADNQEFERLVEEMTAGDSGGDTENIASGKTTGSVTSKGPSGIKQKRKKKDE
ncbi:hypothetical protein [Providencia phage PSTCR6]|nr:hypothetical protein [Providencia phage PSTCR6]